MEEVNEDAKKTTRVIKDQEEIEKEVRNFYSNLYSETRTKSSRVLKL